MSRCIRCDEPAPAGKLLCDACKVPPGGVQRRVSAEWIAGMDACIRGLQFALEQAREWRTEDTIVAHLEAEIDAITDHWYKARGPLPPAPEEEA